MKKLLPLLLVGSASLTAASTAFAYNGSISFSDGERFHHQANVHRIVEVASDCLNSDLQKHRAFLSNYGVSAFYGENAAFAVRTEVDPLTGREKKIATSTQERQEHLRGLGLSENLVQQLVPSRTCTPRNPCPLKMEPTSCIGVTLKCLARGFQAVGEGEMWQRLRTFVRQNDVQGDSLQYALQRLGWSLAYWNPAPNRAEQWDLAERQRYPGNPKGIWGRHSATLGTVMNQHRYGQNYIDDVDSLVGFGSQQPAALRQIPFFVGIAHLGYHVFSGHYGQIVEGHSTRQVTDPESLETSMFNPLVKGGGPRGGPYKSGVLALPPGYLR